MAKLVYIVSAGHSGSTLLDLLTGSIPGVFSTGEIRRYPWQMAHKNLPEKSVENQNICSCLKPFDECDVWSEVGKSLSHKVGYDIFQDPERFKMSMLIGHAATEKMSLPNWFLNGIYKRSWQYPFLKKAGQMIYNNQLPIIKNSWLLFDTISEVTGSKYVVDSSKDIARMAFLSQYRVNDVYVLINKRDPIRFANSYLKRGKKPRKSLESRYKFYRTVYNILKKNDKIKHLDVLYEDLCKSPKEVRKNIADFLEIELNSFDYKINTKERHLIEGNPMRYKGLIDIKVDDKWKKEIQKKEFDLIKHLSVKYSI